MSRDVFLLKGSWWRGRTYPTGKIEGLWGKASQQYVYFGIYYNV